MAPAVLPTSFTMFAHDSAPTVRFHVTDSATGAPIDLSTASVDFFVRRIGRLTNVYSIPSTSCLVLPSQPQLTQNVYANGIAQSVRVSSTSGFGVGNVIAVGAGTTNAEDVIVTAITNTTHLSGVFTLDHAALDLFDLVDLAQPRVLGANVSSSGSPQSVLLDSSAQLAVGNQVVVGYGTANVETLTITAIVDGTHMTGVFTKAHSTNDTVRYAHTAADSVYAGRNGFCTYAWPAGGLAGTGSYEGQLRFTFAGGAVQHSQLLGIDVLPSLETLA